MELDAFKAVIEFALEREKEAVEFYQECAGSARNNAMKQAFLDMAEEEKKHVRMLDHFEPGQIETVRLKEIPNLKIADYIVATEFDPGMSYKEVLELAMQREDSAYRLYTTLSSDTNDPHITKLFQILAQEELKHKNRFEREYDEVVYRDA